MYHYIEPYSIKDIYNNAALVATADTVNVGARKFMISNTGAQPLYFKEKNSVDALATNAMLCPANTVFPVVLTATTLSVVSNATGTSYTIMYLDM